ncbi:hypothetical protein SNE40_016979 [Patella caerulea]|uniref:SOCS box domain-containing protein n=2 Tax=Patella caerulea TaxID=87958 RepID=A0AAN8J9J4_PATCE
MPKENTTANPTGQYRMVKLPRYTRAWIVLFSGYVKEWEPIAGNYGMDKYTYYCDDSSCDRENFCVQYIRASVKIYKKLLEIQRYKSRTLCIPFGDDLIYYIINQYKLRSVAAAQRASLILLVLHWTENMQSKVTFPLVDLDKQSVLGIIEAPHKNMTVIHCEITPDLSRTAILFYFHSDSQRTFCYNLFLFCNKTMEVVENYTLNHEVQPYMAFDPRFCWSRVAIANYECREEGIKHELVLFSLSSGKVYKRSNLSLPSLFGGSCFHLLYSIDGALLILQKLTEDRFGVTSYSDIYLFNSDQLMLIKYVTASLPGLFHICMTNYEPKFSNCGSYMRILDYKSANGDRGITVKIYQLPRCLNLKSQCRIMILQNLKNNNYINQLPLPNRLKEYLKFSPMWN